MSAANPPSAAASHTRRRWWTVFALSAASLIDSMESFTMSILWPHMYPTLGLRVGQLGPVASVSGLVGTVMTPVWGFLADRFSRKWLLVLITGMWGLWTSAIGLVHNFYQLLGVRIASSLGLAALTPTALSLVSDLFGRKERGRAIGIFTAAGFSGSMVSFIVLPMLATRDPEGWRLGFLFIGAASFVSGVLLLFVKEPPRGSAEPELEDVVSEETAARFEFRLLPRLLRVASWRLLLVNETLDWMGFSTLYTWAFTWLESLRLGMMGTAVIGIQFVGVLVGHVAFGWMGDALDARSPERGRVTLGTVGLIVNVLACVGFLLTSPYGLLPLLVFGMLTGLTESLKMSGARAPLAQNVMLPELRATGRGTIAMVSGLASALIALLAGWMVTQFGDNVLAMMLILVPIPKALSIAAWLPLYRTYPRDMEALHATLCQQRAAIVATQGRG
jgi:MFS family permease